MAQKVIIIGGGFGGLAAACLLAKDGYDVTVMEKNNQLGGRAGTLTVAQNTKGEWIDIAAPKRGARQFVFDTGPSWYLMPDVFEHFFELMDEKIDDYFELEKLWPSYRVFFKDMGMHVDMTGDLELDVETFESIEAGAGKQLRAYLHNAEYTYNMAVGKFLYKNYDSLLDFLTPDLLKGAPKLHIFSNMDRYVRRYFKDPRLQKIMQYPLVFLGSSPYNAPALYNLMSHVDFNQGVFYPKGGMYKVVEALVKIGRKHGVRYLTNTEVSSLLVRNRRAYGVMANGTEYLAHMVVSDADVHHTEQQLLSPEYHDHSERYWNKRTLAPSALLMYIGVDKQYDSLLHHSLLFSQDWQTNFKQIFDEPSWPVDPSIYVSATSKTDGHVAPKGCENIFVLVPIAPGLKDTPEQLENYADRVLETMETEMNLPDLRKHILFKRMRSVSDFEQRYNSFKGTGLGLAHTLFQTALWRPSNRSRKLRDLYYVGANVHPGIGLPVTLISAELLLKRLKSQ